MGRGFRPWPRSTVPVLASPPQPERLVVIRSMWRFVVVLFLVPVVAFSTPSTAQAFAPTQTEWVGAQWHFSGLELGFGQLFEADCEGSFSMRSDALGQQIMRAGAGNCVGGLDGSWTCQVFEPDCTEYKITFNGPDCSPVVLAPETRTVSADGWRTVASGWEDTEALSGGCDPTHVCLEPDGGPNGPGPGALGSEHQRLCTVIDLDPGIPGQDPPPDCPLGVPTVTYTNPSGLQSIKVTIHSTKSTSHNWRFAWKYSNSGTIWPSGNDTQIVAAPNTSTEFTNANGNSGVVLLDGVEIYAESHGTNAGGHDPRADDVAGAYPPATPSFGDGIGFWGITHETACRFFIANNPVTRPIPADAQYADPYLAPNTVPTPPPVSDPPVTDPGPIDGEEPGDEAGFWGSILAVLRAIWSAVKALGGAIVRLGQAIITGITDALTYLFIPDSVDLMEDVEETEDAWADTSVSSWSSSFFGQGFSMPASGCDGLPVNFTLPGDVPIDMDLGASCSGGIHTAANIVKGISTGAMVLFGGLACVRALGSGFGWNPGIGQRGAA